MPSPFENLHNLANKARENGWVGGGKIEQEIGISKKQKESFDKFWKERFKLWLSGNINLEDFQFNPIMTTPKDLPYKELVKERDPARFGEYYLNSETQHLQFDQIKPVTIDLASMDTVEFHNVFKYIVETYGDKYYLPGVEYQNWLSQNPNKIPDELKDSVAKYYFPTSIVCFVGGGWSVGYSKFNGAQMDNLGTWLGNPPKDPKSKVVLLPKPLQ